MSVQSHASAVRTLEIPNTDWQPHWYLARVEILHTLVGMGSACSCGTCVLAKVHTDRHTDTQTHTHTHTHARTHARTHAHTHTHTHTHARTHARTNASTHSHTNTHTHTIMIEKQD